MANGATTDILRQVGRLFGEGTIAGLTDRQLLDRFRSRADEAAFEAIVARHGPMVLGVCRDVLRNSADAVAYQVERQLQEIGAGAPANEKARAEQLISELRRLVQSNSDDLSRLRQLTSDLQQLAAGLNVAPHTQGPGDYGRGSVPAQPESPYDVIDAEFTQR